MSVELERFVRERAESYGALRQSAITAVALDKAADQLQRYREALKAHDWQPIESAPRDEPFLAALEVHHNKTGQSWWEMHTIWIDSETGEINSDNDAGWSAGDYTHWMPLPDPPARQSLQEPKP